MAYFGMVLQEKIRLDRDDFRSIKIVFNTGTATRCSGQLLIGPGFDAALGVNFILIVLGF